LKYDVSLISSVIIFIATSAKSIFDLIINPWVHAKSVTKEKKSSKPNYTKLGIQKRYRSDVSTTLVFLVVSIATFFIIKESMMNENVSKKEFQKLVLKVEKIEKVIFPNDPGGHGAIALPERIKRIEEKVHNMEQQLIETSSKVDTISIEYAKKEKEKIAKMQREQERIKRMQKNTNLRAKAVAK
jgi:hypothetical protein